MIKNIFFSFKKSKIMYGLFLLVIVLWGTIFSQAMSSVGFKKNFTNKYNKNLPVNDAFGLQINIMHNLELGNKSKFYNNLKKIIGDKRKENQISILLAEVNFIHRDEFKIDLSKYRRAFVSGGWDDTVELVTMNYDYLEFLKNKMNISTVKVNSGEIPVIMGYNFKKDFKENDLIEGTEGKYRIIGFFEKDVFYTDGPSAAMYFRSLDSALVIPDNNIVPMNYAMIKSKNKDFDIFKFQDDINSLANINFTETFTKDLNEFFYSEEAIESNKVLMLKFIFMSFLNIMVINGIITFIISENKKKIGIIYAVGGNMSLIFKQILKECSIVLVLGVLLGIPINYQFTKYSFMHFLNENRVETVIIASVVLSITVILNIAISLLYLRRFSTRDLIGGLRSE